MFGTIGAAAGAIGGKVLAPAAKAVVGEAIARKVSRRAREAPVTGAKGLIQSKTAWGVGILAGAAQLAPAIAWAVTLLAGVLGYEMGPEAAAEIAQRLIEIFGAGLAIYGRIKASRPIAR